MQNEVLLEYIWKASLPWSKRQHHLSEKSSVCVSVCVCVDVAKPVNIWGYVFTTITNIPRLNKIHDFVRGGPFER